MRRLRRPFESFDQGLHWLELTVMLLWSVDHWSTCFYSS